MKKSKTIISLLILSLIMLVSITFEQLSSAQGEPNLTCNDVSCNSPAACNEAGTASGCKLTCFSGSKIQCDGGPKPPGTPIP